MFDTLFAVSQARQRHREGPLAAERSAYLKTHATRGSARSTLLRRARLSLYVAKELEAWPREHCFSEEDVEALTSSWAAKRVASGRASASRRPQDEFRFVAAEFINTLGWLAITPPSPQCRDGRVEEFVAAQGEKAWQSSATRKVGRWHVRRFLSYLEDEGHDLECIRADHVDAYFLHVSLRWSRLSIRKAASVLRKWLRHCEAMGWAKPGVARAIILPRIYRHEGLPLGPTWDQISRMIAEADGDSPAHVRARAVLLLLSVYGLRSGEVRGLRLDDIHWQKDRFQVVRSKSRRRETLPLESCVGNAIALYLRSARPPSNSRVLFLTLLAPHRPLSAGALYNIVRRYLSSADPARKKSLGPHALRHACARRLLDSGLSMKEIGDHLGHRNPESTRTYAKVDLNSLRRVALESLGDLS